MMADVTSFEESYLELSPNSQGPLFWLSWIVWGQILANYRKLYDCNVFYTYTFLYGNFWVKQTHCGLHLMTPIIIGNCLSFNNPWRKELIGRSVASLLIKSAQLAERTLLFDWTPQGTHFTKSFWAHNWNLMKILIALTCWIIVISGHNFAHGTTAELPWHVQICDLIWSLKLELKWKICIWDFSYKLITFLYNGSQGSLSQILFSSGGVRNGTDRW